MSNLPVSVVIVSRGRPDALKRCLTGVAQLQYDPFEVVVVADPAGLAAAGAMPFAEALKLEAFDEANISAARNLGVVHAAGELVAFIDDDAVPEPLWLKHLAHAAESGVAALGGFVRGRNGISFQWRAQSLDGGGLPEPLEVHPERPTVLHPPKGRAVKTEGTNMAVRREVLVALGGFDPAFRYFLDETDLNMRLARAGHGTAIVPLAEVHHGFEANAVRSAARVPRDLFEIGASWAVFQRKHMGRHAHAGHWAARRAEQRRRLVEHMVRGNLEPGQIAPMLLRLDLGYEEGQSRRLGEPGLPAHPAAPFKRFPSRARKPGAVVGRSLGLRGLRAQAAERVAAGELVTLICLSPTALYHRVRFTEAGVWEHRGGVFGRAERDGPLFRLSTLGRRARAELARVAPQRGKSGDNTRKRNK